MRKHSDIYKVVKRTCFNCAHRTDGWGGRICKIHKKNVLDEAPGCEQWKMMKGMEQCGQ